MGTWTVRYRTGVAGVDESGRIRLAWRSVSDWPNPQFDDPRGANYVSVRTSGAARLVPSFGITGVRPWSKTLIVRVTGEALAPGLRVDQDMSFLDAVRLTWDLRGGSPASVDLPVFGRTTSGGAAVLELQQPQAGEVITAFVAGDPVPAPEPAP